MEITDELLTAHHALVPRDNEFQRRARLHQALWRERKGLPIGEHRGRPLGSRLAMPVQVAVGDQHTCVRRRSGKVACVGAPISLGRGDTTFDWKPIDVPLPRE